jgi:uncharacterized protein (TIGR02444 family)
LSGTEDEADLWQFAVRLYGQDGVAAACLRLQETYGADVPLLLSAAWLAMSGVTLSPDHARKACDLVQDWHAEIVRGLRALRTRLKAGPFPAPSAASEAVRSSVKRIELESEKIELACLAACFSGMGAGGQRIEARANLDLMFATATGTSAEIAAQDLGVLADGVKGIAP